MKCNHNDCFTCPYPDCIKGVRVKKEKPKATKTKPKKEVVIKEKKKVGRPRKDRSNYWNEYYAKNAERIRENNRKRYYEKREEIQEKQRKYRKEHIEYYREYSRRYYRERIKHDNERENQSIIRES